MGGSRMKQIFFIPRLYLPREGFEKWSSLAGDRFAYSKEYYKACLREAGDAPSTLRFVRSENFSDGESEFVQEVREEMYTAMECEKTEKLLRGAMLTERKTEAGARRGIVACIDLEAYTVKRGEESAVRPVQEADTACAERLARLRERLPLEFSHAVVLYKDPKNKVLSKLAKENLEELYDFKLSGGGGRLRGWFLPAFLAEDVLDGLPRRGDPSFIAADGVTWLAGAKLHWEKVKESLSSKECLRHPARFALVELENLCDDAVKIEPVSRLVYDTDNEAFCDFICRSAPCERKGTALYCKWKTDSENIAAADELIREYLCANGGNLSYVCGERETLEAVRETEGAALLFAPVKKEEVFAHAKDGKLFPKKSFALGGEADARYYTEGREVNYD